MANFLAHRRAGKVTYLLAMAWTVAVLSAPALGQNIPKGYLLPDNTLSPDRRYGVTVPIFDLDKDLDRQNKVVEAQSGRVLAVIHAEVGYDRRLNFRETLPARWSSDGSLLVWTVAGKWSPNALVALKIEKGQVKWQVEILEAAQKAILARTKKAAPKQYAAVKKEAERETEIYQAKYHDSTPSGYPDGLTIDADVAAPIAFPLKVHVKLSANPKRIQGALNLDSHLDAVITSEGAFLVKDFQLGAEEW